MARIVTLNQIGAVWVPMALIACSLTSASALGWKLMHRFRAQAEVQIRLDRCTGEAALTLRNRLNRMERSIARFRSLRAALLIPLPATQAAARAGLKLELAFQEALQLRWNADQLRWRIGLGCSNTRLNLLSRPYPEFPWRRDPPDPLGPGELRWKASESSRFRVQAESDNRISAAEAQKNDQKNEKQNESWSAFWIPPE